MKALYPVKLEDKNNISHFACMNMGVIALQLMHAYDTAAFLLQYEHHCAVWGSPKFVHSDPGIQIKRATYYLADPTNNTKLDKTKIVDVDARKGTTWKICHTARQ